MDRSKLSFSFLKRIRPLRGHTFTDRELWVRRTGDMEMYLEEVQRYLLRREHKKNK